METKVKAIIAEQLYVKLEEVTDEKELMADLKADELDMVELIMAMEEHFGWEIRDEETENWKTVKDVVVFMKGLKEKNAGG